VSAVALRNTVAAATFIRQWQRVHTPTYIVFYDNERDNRQTDSRIISQPKRRCPVSRADRMGQMTYFALPRSAGYCGQACLSDLLRRVLDRMTRVHASAVTTDGIEIFSKVRKPRRSGHVGGVSAGLLGIGSGPAKRSLRLVVLFQTSYGDWPAGISCD
jgi:hypothetical protein